MPTEESSLPDEPVETGEQHDAHVQQYLQVIVDRFIGQMHSLLTELPSFKKLSWEKLHLVVELDSDHPSAAQDHENAAYILRELETFAQSVFTTYLEQPPHVLKPLLLTASADSAEEDLQSTHDDEVSIPEGSSIEG